MKLEYVPPTKMGRQRRAWFRGLVKPGMKFEEAVKLNEKALLLFPPTDEERRLKTESLKAMPAFVF